MTMVDSLDKAAAYIKKLEERVDELRHKRDELRHKRSSAQLLASKRGDGVGASTSAAVTPTGFATVLEEVVAAEEPVVEVRYNHDASSLVVVLVSSVEWQFKLHEVVTVLEEEGAKVINANFSVHDRKIVYTIHSQVPYNNPLNFSFSLIYYNKWLLGKICYMTLKICGNYCTTLKSKPLATYDLNDGYMSGYWSM